MIDLDTFSAEWAELDAHFPGERSKSEARRYYRWLKDRLTTEEFVDAADLLYAHREHFPRPVDFVEAARPSGDEEALEQWDLCRQIMSDRRRGPEILETMTEEGRRVVRAMGGPRALCRTALDEVPFRRREFLNLYGTLRDATDRKELPAMTEDGRKQLEAATSGTEMLE